MKKEELSKMPAQLSAKGEEAYRAIMAVLNKNKTTYTGGCKSFYSPEEWRERGEYYGEGSELIVVYDGGDLMMYFSYDNCVEALQTEMVNALEKVGMRSECCTGWCSAVYCD